MTKEEKLARKQQRKAEKVGLGKLLLWNSSSCSVALSTLMLGYATFYCTDVLQLAPALVGTLFMVSKIFDSFTDVVAGFIVDRTQTRWGKGRPYEIFMLFLWLSTWLLFSCPTSFATAAKCIWIFCMYTFIQNTSTIHCGWKKTLFRPTVYSKDGCMCATQEIKLAQKSCSFMCMMWRQAWCVPLKNWWGLPK